MLALSHVVRSPVVCGGAGDAVGESCAELVHEAFRWTHQRQVSFRLLLSILRIQYLYGSLHLSDGEFHRILVDEPTLAHVGRRQVTVRRPHTLNSAYLVSGTPPTRWRG